MERFISEMACIVSSESLNFILVTHVQGAALL